MNLFGGATGLVHINNFDLQSADANFVVGRGRLSLVECIYQYLGAIDSRYAKAFRRLTGEKTDDADFESLLRHGSHGAQADGSRGAQAK